MMEEIHQIVYLSVATRKMEPQELADILEIARKKNDACNITGMLLFRSGYFLQVLEGPYDKLHTLLAKLNRDPRHSQVRVLLDAPIQTRVFGTWSMAFQDVSGLEPATMPAYSQFLSNGFSATECVRYPHKALRMVLAFRDAASAQLDSLTAPAR